jgi:hypothetical protein
MCALTVVVRGQKREPIGRQERAGMHVVAGFRRCERIAEQRKWIPLLFQGIKILDTSIGENILKLDESCISDPKSEISNWTGDSHGSRTCKVQSEISDFGSEMQDSSNFEMFK